MHTEEFYMLLSGLSLESRFFAQLAEINKSAANTSASTDRVEVTSMKEFRNAIGR